MKPRSTPLAIILPTDELVDEFATSANLLQLVNITVKDLLAYAVDFWANDPFPEYLADLTPVSKVHHYMEIDFLNYLDWNEYDSRDLRDIRRTMTHIASAAYAHLMPAVDKLPLSDEQELHLHARRWLGNSLVLDTY
jgi:hypothetical protein